MDEVELESTGIETQKSNGRRVVVISITMDDVDDPFGSCYCRWPNTQNLFFMFCRARAHTLTYIFRPDGYDGSPKTMTEILKILSKCLITKACSLSTAHMCLSRQRRP